MTMTSPQVLIETRSVTILNQTNALNSPYSLSVMLVCDNFTDISGFPLLMAADDMVLPSNGEECKELIFNFNTLRTKHDLDPLSITIQLFNHNTVDNIPMDQPFFKRTICSPNNDPSNCSWDRRLQVPILTTIKLHNGDIDDNQVTLFNISFNHTFRQYII